MSLTHLISAVVVAFAFAPAAHAHQSEAPAAACARIISSHWSHLSAGDKSVLRTSLPMADAAVVTVEGSPLAPVYAELTAAALMEKLEESLPAPMLQYGWTELGRAHCTLPAQ